jgi:hypothetical protein
VSSLSARYATPTLVVLALALIPTIVSSYVRPMVVEHPRLSEALPTVLDGRQSTPTSRRASIIKKEFDTDDWVERQYVRPGDAPVKVLAVRSYDMKRLYHHPELAVTEADYAAAQVAEVPTARGPLDVHVLVGTNGDGMAAYALLYRTRTVSNPLLFQLTVAPELLLTGRRPLTLVFAEDSAYRASPGSDLAQSSAVQAVTRAVQALIAGKESST